MVGFLVLLLLFFGSLLLLSYSIWNKNQIEAISVTVWTPYVICCWFVSFAFVHLVFFINRQPLCVVLLLFLSIHFIYILTPIQKHISLRCFWIRVVVIPAAYNRELKLIPPFPNNFCTGFRVCTFFLRCIPDKRIEFHRFNAHFHKTLLIFYNNWNLLCYCVSVVVLYMCVLNV